jgi:hypothetical protein
MTESKPENELSMSARFITVAGVASESIDGTFSSTDVFGNVLKSKGNQQLTNKILSEEASNRLTVSKKLSRGSAISISIVSSSFLAGGQGLRDDGTRHLHRTFHHRTRRYVVPLWNYHGPELLINISETEPSNSSHGPENPMFCAINNAKLSIRQKKLRLFWMIVESIHIVLISDNRTQGENPPAEYDMFWILSQINNVHVYLSQFWRFQANESGFWPLFANWNLTIQRRCRA